VRSAVASPPLPVYALAAASSEEKGRGATDMARGEQTRQADDEAGSRARQ